MRQWVALCALLIAAVPAQGDYLELRRNANIYGEASRHSEQIGRLDFEAGTPQYIDLADPALANGYYQIVIPDSDDTGYIYRTLVRRYPGLRPDEAVSQSIPIEDEEIGPDIVDDFGVTTAPLDPVDQPGLQIFVFDLGQADSLLVVGPPPGMRTLLVDVGENLSGDQDNFETVRRRIMEITGEPRVDYLLISHFHHDHAGHPGRGGCSSRGRLNSSGLFGLLNDDQQVFTVGMLLDRGDDLRYTPRRSTAHCGIVESVEGWVSANRVGQRRVPVIGMEDIDLGPSVSVEVLAVGGRVAVGDMGAMAFAQGTNPNLYSESQPASENDYSIAIEVSLGDFEFFTAGDLTGRSDSQRSDTHQVRRFGDDALVYTNVEGYMVDSWRKQDREANVEVYRANHHGSGHSSSADLASVLDPEVVIYSTGGSYGHPAAATVNRFQGRVQLVTTMVSAETYPDGLPLTLGEIVGEIRIGVAADGSRYQIGDWVNASLSDAEESL